MNESSAGQPSSSSRAADSSVPDGLAEGSIARPHFGSALEPALHDASHGRLSAVTWFRTDWQRGGALTGYATYRQPDPPSPTEDVEIEVVVKLPVPPHERQWLMHLQGYENVAPRLYLHGEALGDYDIAWVVMERMSHGPLGAAWRGREFELLIEAAGRFYVAAADVPLRGEARQRDWRAGLDRARKIVRDNKLPNDQRWSQALKKAHKQVDHWIGVWEDRPVDHWCHGDLHFGNAMTRVAPTGESGGEGSVEGDGGAVLLDYAETRVGCWVEDAIYLEHLFWARRERLGDRKLAKQLARQRKAVGLPVESGWAELATVRRALVAMTTPSQLAFDGDPRHVEAALGVLEASL